MRHLALVLMFVVAVGLVTALVPILLVGGVAVEIARMIVGSP